MINNLGIENRDGRIEERQVISLTELIEDPERRMYFITILNNSEYYFSKFQEAIEDCLEFNWNRETGMKYISVVIENIFLEYRIDLVERKYEYALFENSILRLSDNTELESGDELDVET